RSEVLAQALRRRPRQIDEDEAGPHVAVDGGETEQRLVDAEELVLLMDVRASAVEPVAPAVVLAHELATGAAALLPWRAAPYELVATMAADVVEGADLAVHIASDEERGPSGRQLLGEISAVARQVVDTTDVQPRAPEDGIALELVELRRHRILERHPTGAELGIVSRPRSLGWSAKGAHTSTLLLKARRRRGRSALSGRPGTSRSNPHQRLRASAARCGASRRSHRPRARCSCRSCPARTSTARAAQHRAPAARSSSCPAAGRRTSRRPP